MLSVFFAASLLIVPVFGKLQSPGGSNYYWYNMTCGIDPIAGKPCANYCDVNCRAPYGIIPTYHQSGVQDLVKNELAQMFKNGQRRLRIPLYHQHGYSDTEIVDSTGGNVNSQVTTNINNFLQDCVNAGFVEFVFGFFPLSDNYPFSWKSWNENLYQENWNVVVNVRKQSILPVLGNNQAIQYTIDLCNEIAPPTSGFPYLEQYVSRMWSDYVGSFGKVDTLGFSIGNNMDVDTSRYVKMIQLMDATGHGRPYLYDFHIYASPSSMLSTIDSTMKKYNDAAGIIVGETFYAASDYESAFKSAQLSRPIFWVAQWPLSEVGYSKGSGVDDVPINFLYVAG